MDATIRAALPADADAIAGIYEPYVRDTVISFEEVPPTATEMRERVARSTAWLVAEVDGAIVGYAYAAPFHVRPAYRASQEVSIYLAGDATGRGLGAVLLDELLTRLREAGMANAIAGIALPNPASQRLFESRGFHHVGTYARIGCKFDQWLDVGWWQLELTPRA